MKKISVLTILLVLFTALMQGHLLAQDDDMLKLKPGQPIIVDGDKVEYFETQGKIVAEGNVSITYGDVKLSCDEIEVNTKTRTALCRGNVRIEHEEGVLTGDLIQYDFNKQEGKVLGGEVDAFPWFGQAKETAKVGENEYLLRDGFVTTCDLDEPHYRIKAGEIRVFPDEKVIAKNVTVYIGKVPVLWFPYYYHPVIQSRAKVQFIPGWNTDWGYFLLSAWRFYIKGNTRVDVIGDYRTKKGFAEGANLYYYMDDVGLKGLGQGFLRTYFIQQNDIGTYDPTSFRDGNDDVQKRQVVQWKHRIDFDPETVGILEFNKYSDEFVLKDYFYDEYEENPDKAQNYATIISSKRNYSFLLNVEKRFNDFYTVTEKLPELKLDVPDQRLWETPFYYSQESSATVFSKQYKGEQHPPEKVDRLDTFHKLSYVTKIFFLNITPFGTLRETLYTRTKWEGKAVGRTAFGGGVNVFSRFHRIYDVTTNMWNMDINGLRHIIVPSATYFHTHQPTVDKDNLYQMDDIDKLEKENGITFSLENKLQTKRHEGGELRSVDLVRFIMSTDFLFRMEKDRFKFEKEGKFDKVKFDLELNPYKWFYIDSELEVRPENQAVKAGSVEASIRPWDGFSFDFGYRYEKKAPDPRNQLTFDLFYRLNPKWAVGLYERFDLQDGVIEEQQISIVRDLHCWEVEFVYDVDGPNFFKDDFTIWFAFKIKAFPDLPIGLSRSYVKHKPGARE